MDHSQPRSRQLNVPEPPKSWQQNSRDRRDYGRSVLQVRRLSDRRSDARPEEEHGHDPTIVGIGVGSEPAKARAVFRACTGLTQHWFFNETAAKKPRGAIFDGARHAVREFRNDWSNVQFAFHFGSEIRNLFRRRGVLQVVQRSPPLAMAAMRAPSCNGVNEMLSPKEHIFPTPPSLASSSVEGKVPRCSPGMFQPASSPKSELMRVITHLFEAQLLSHGRKIRVVGMRQGSGQIHSLVLAERNLGVLSNDVFTQRR